MPRPIARVLALGVLLVATDARADCRYEASVSPDVVVDVTARCKAPVAGFAPPGPAIEPFVSDLARGPGPSVRYRVDLLAAAETRDSIDVAVRVGDSVIATAPTWLVAPEGPAETAIEVEVTVPSGMGFAAAAADGGGTLRYRAGDLAYGGFAVFGTFARQAIGLAGGARADLVVLDGALDLDESVLADWIAGRLEAAGAFWGGSVAPRPLVAVIPVADSGGVIFGLTRSGGGVGIALFLGRHTEPADLEGDWVLAHELVHAGMPFVPGAPWFMEGLAVYLEPIVRVRAGLLAEAAMWRGFAASLGRGARVLAAGPLAEAGFPDFYWGGAVLMLVADVEARLRSGGRLGLEDCLRAVHAEVGDASRTLDLAAMIATCDRVLGPAFGDRVRRHAETAAPVDLDALWADFGVDLTAKGVDFDDGVPRAWVRRAIVAGGSVEAVP